MANQPFDPFRGRTYRRRQRLPLPALVLIAIAPALLVSAFILWRSSGDNSAPDTTAAATAPEAPSEGRSVPLLASRSTTPEPTRAPDKLAAAPQSMGIEPPEITASAFVVVDDASMEMLLSRDPYSPRAPASITKMATAVVALEQGRLDEVVTSDVHYWDLASEADSTTMGLMPGDELTLRELLYGLLMVSGNDAARVIAHHISGTEGAFVAKMNELAERLGMEDTHFVTVDGLSAPGHASSPWDLVLLSRYLMRFPDLREIVGTETYTAHGLRLLEEESQGEGQPEDQRERTEVAFDLYNGNPLLNYTPGVDGIKTGFTEEAGPTYALTVERDGHRIYIVLMDSTLRVQDAERLIDWTYQNFIWPGDDAPPSTVIETPIPQ